MNERQSADAPPSDAVSRTAQERAICSLRVWPAVLLLVSLWSLRIVPGLFETLSMPLMMARFMGPLLCAGLILLWWLFFSRALWKEKVLALAGLAIIVTATTLWADKSIRGFGTMIFAVPWGISAFAVVLVALSGWHSTRRTWLALLAALIGFGFWDLVRTDEIRGDFRASRSWRWQPTAEDRFLESLASRARQRDSGSTADAGPLAEPQWPAFRGPHRNGVQPGVALDEDWQANPLEELWRIRVGPGWSSFSVAGDRLFTQEQRGEHEAVVCYDANSGREIWERRNLSRFWEAVGGAGPRGTPTLSDGSLYTLGATGFLQRLNPLTGEVIWQRDMHQDAGRSNPPQWGYASSPLVTEGAVVVHAGGPGDRGLLAYETDTSDIRWTAPAGDHSYSSPQLANPCGKPCVLMLTNLGLTLHEPATGSLLGQHDWIFQGYRVVQPLVMDDSGVLLGTGMGTGTQRIELSLEGEQFTVRERWTSRDMSPYYNDYVAHDGYLYGFDNNIFACVDLADGRRKWKKGRYGNGQVVLLPDADQLLVISEDGELVLLRATPERLVELARQPVLDGRTWNHPVVVGNRLYVRNGEEAACFEVKLQTVTGAERISARPK